MLSGQWPVGAGQLAILRWRRVARDIPAKKLRSAALIANCQCRRYNDLLPDRELNVSLASTRRSGGIGRRAWFRSMYPQGCGGSSPFFGTKTFLEVLRCAQDFACGAHARKAAQVRVPSSAPRHSSRSFAALRISTAGLTPAKQLKFESLLRHQSLPSGPAFADIKVHTLTHTYECVNLNWNGNQSCARRPID